MDKNLLQAIDHIAQSKGFKHGHYTIDLETEYEFIHRGVEMKVKITPEKGNCIYIKIKKPQTTANDLKIPWSNYFFNNVHYYATVLPILKTYGSVPMSPKYYGSSLKKGEEYLILEDLERSEQYKKFSFSPGLNRQQIKEVIKMLAHFHCTVRLWRTKAPAEFKAVCGLFKPFLSTKYPFPQEVGNYEKWMKEMITAIWIMLRRQGLDFRGPIENLLKNFRKLMSDAFKAGPDIDDQQWCTLVNCIAYARNVLFKHHTISGAVIDVGLEDWGAIRLGSPALDLTLLLFSSPALDLYSDINSLVDEYFTDYVPLVQLREEHFPRYGLFGVVGSIAVLVAVSIEDDLVRRVSKITAKELADESFISNRIPDLQARLVAILKAAVECKIL